MLCPHFLSLRTSHAPLVEQPSNHSSALSAVYLSTLGVCLFVCLWLFQLQQEANGANDANDAKDAKDAASGQTQVVGNVMTSSAKWS